jgi:predicted hotdog family 3-hydroxylacyl-ACP dehydratase
LIEKEELQTIIPHRGKMFLLSRVNGYDLEKRNLNAEYHITEDCIFYDPNIGGVPSWVGFEFMAQAISALSGIRDREMGIKPRMGFILSIPSMQMEVPVFPLGSRVELHVQEKDNVDLIYTFDGAALLDGRKAMEGTLMVMEVNEEIFDNLIKESN